MKFNGLVEYRMKRQQINFKLMLFSSCKEEGEKNIHSCKFAELLILFLLKTYECLLGNFM